MNLQELQKALETVRVHLECIRTLIRLLEKSEPVHVRQNYCPECGERTMYFWCAPSILWNKKVLEEKPWEFNNFVRFTGILDGQCFNFVCGNSVWPALTRMDPTLLETAPANAILTHGDKLYCRHCRQMSVTGCARDGKTIAGLCNNCKKTTLRGDIARERWRLYLALYRREITLMVQEGLLSNQILKLIPSARQTLPGIGDPDDGDDT